MFSGYPHRGRDAGCVVGTPIAEPSQLGGTVVPCTNDGSFGNAVCVQYGNGLFGLVAHLSRIDVQIGARVIPGQQLGLSGNTGLSTGPHCHFQLCTNTQFPTDISYSRDPRQFLITEATPMTAAETAAFNELKGRVDTLEAIVIENGFDAVCRPGTEDLFPKGTPVVPEGLDGPRIRLTGDAASEYAKRRGFSLGLAIEAVQK